MRQIRRIQKCPPKLWNFYETAILGLTRTNNGLEGWHNILQEQVGGHQVTI
ncbi:Hypothetical protein CINCED_3A007305 [Cinara cedri]|uniref:Uncharacterized protein n=1 Tax=Cinara cedri TaxID=506608 RepID=A0A5E4MWQ5_9HEMI|nr:Hypothetical protein CINCED_3A007305 [Cinara cedri]